MPGVDVSVASSRALLSHQILFGTVARSWGDSSASSSKKKSANWPTNSAIDLLVKIRVNNTRFGYTFQHAMFRRRVSQILIKFVKTLHIYLLNLENIIFRYYYEIFVQTL